MKKKEVYSGERKKRKWKVSKTKKSGVRRRNIIKIAKERETKI